MNFPLTRADVYRRVATDPPKPPPMTWHKITLSTGATRRQYMTRDGKLTACAPGETCEVDRECLKVLRMLGHIAHEF